LHRHLYRLFQASLLLTLGSHDTLWHPWHGMHFTVLQCWSFFFSRLSAYQVHKTYVLLNSSVVSTIAENSKCSVNVQWEETSTRKHICRKWPHGQSQRDSMWQCIRFLKLLFILLIFLETGSHCEAQAGLKVMILLPQPLQY
jgi:hypothetical protein